MKPMQAPLVGALLVLAVLAGCAPRQIVKSKASVNNIAAKALLAAIEPPIDTNTVQGAEMVKYNLKPGEYERDLQKAKEYIRDYYLYGTVFNPDTCSSFSSLLDSLDPQTFFFGPERYNQIYVQPSGSCSSAGFSIAVVSDKYCAVSKVIYGGPAWKAGLAEGDIIRVVDKKSCRSKSTDEVMTMVSKQSTPLDLLVWRVVNNDTVALAMSLDEGDVPNQYVPPAVMLPNHVGYIDVNRFRSGIAQAVRGEILKLVHKGMKQLILDLRSNPGGYVGEAHCLASQFLPPGSIVSIERGKGISRIGLGPHADSAQLAAYADTTRAFGEDIPGAYQNYFSQIKGVQGGSFLKGEMIVLIDEGSASASEMIASALRYCKRAILLGSPSYGKGRIQRSLDLPSHGYLHITIGEYTAGDGRRIDKYLSKDSVGLIPDIAAEPRVFPELSDALQEKINHEVASWFSDLAAYRRSLDSGVVLPHQLCELYGHPLYRAYLSATLSHIYGNGYMQQWHSESDTIQLAWQKLMNMREKPSIAQGSTTLKRSAKRKR